LAAALPDLLSGRVPYSMAVLPPILGHIKDGKLRVLATTGAERSPIVPDAPTFTEAGYPKANMAAWYGVFGPKGLPDELVAQLNQDINAVVQAPDVAEQFAAQGIVITGTMTPPQMPAYMDGEVSRWMEALKAAGITD
jgi:tripartite-type tricarboxylate transporter receptor subunit TctC